jgi:predicted  nucleic acid-binding Zn-ribbon protein
LALKTDGLKLATEQKWEEAKTKLIAAKAIKTDPTIDAKLAERHIKDANEEISEKARVLEAAKKNIANKEANLKVKKSELDKIIAETDKEEKEYKSLAEKARIAADPRLLASFDRIRNNFRNGLAVVSVVRDACGGCFNSIPPQRQSEIRQHKKIIVCENCGRILVEEEMTEK